MTRTALIIGGSGQIGLASARNLLDHGWQVNLAQRHPEGLPPDLAPRVTSIAMDRLEPGAIARAVGGGVDALIDTMAFAETDARQLLEVEGDVGAFAVISSASVYCDAAGRTLDEAAEVEFPDFPMPIGEDQLTAEPGPATYSTRKVALEQTLLQAARHPVTLLRAGAIYGEGSRHLREWWYVRRILDGRRQVPLAYDGESRFHASATANIAELARVALDQPGVRVLNAADPEALTVTQIGQAIAAAYGVELDLLRFPGPPRDGVGSHPWCVPKPLVLDMARAEALGYRAVTRYEDAVGAACRSVEAAMAAGARMPDYIEKLFDYTAEDAFFAA